MEVKRLFLSTSTVFLPLAIVGVALSQSVNSNLPSRSDSVLALPEAPVRPVIDDYFGTKVVDPYRYMENLQDPEVKAWFKSEDDRTRAILATIPGRLRLLDRIKQLDHSAPYQIQNVQRFREKSTSILRCWPRKRWESSMSAMAQEVRKSCWSIQTGS
jgi:Prolyl oligopeptidase, N-terminal beta-propeller domain